MLTNRQESVLQLIVEEYIKSAEPVGSRTLSKLLEFSPATIRNEMADLEDLGYLEKTHTSSGRIPSDQGYHYYIEQLLSDSDHFNPNYNVIDELFSNQDIKRDDAIKQAMNLLSQLTNYTTISLGSGAYGARVKKIELIPIHLNQVVLLVITNQGHVESKNLTLPEGTDIEEMKRVIEIFNDILFDCPIAKVSEKLHYEINHREIKELLAYNKTIIETFLEAFTKFAKSELYVSGQSNMLYQPEFNDINRVRELLTFFEKNDIFKLVENTEQHGLTVRIGKENTVKAMQDCTVITVPYEVANQDSGTIAIVGPTRMEYQKVIPLIKYLAAHMSKLYKE